MQQQWSGLTGLLVLEAGAQRGSPHLGWLHRRAQSLPMG